MTIPAHIAAWGLEQIRRDPRLAEAADQVAHRLRRDSGGDPERILKAEPVSIGAAVLSIFSITGASTFVAAAVGYGVLIGASIGLSYAARAFGSGRSSLPNSDASSINSPSIKYNERQPIPSKRIIYGTAQVGGALFFEAVKPPYLYQGLLICAEPITAFRKMWIGTTEISFASGLTPNTILTPIAVTGQPNYPGRLKVSVRLGSATQTIDPLLAADFPNLAASFRQMGIATAVLRYHFGADQTEFTALWGQVQRPNPLFLVDGVAIPDPRNPGHITSWDPNSPSSLAAARATWSFSNNAALVQNHYLTQRYGGRIDPARIDWSKLAAAADWDDGLIGCLDGTFIKRHTIDGVVTLNQSPSEVLQGMLRGNRGFVLQSAGKSWVSSSLPRAAVATIHDGLLTGPVDYRAAKPKRDLVNRVKTEFVANDREYQTTVGPVLTRTDLQALDGEILDASLSLPFTMDARRAQRLAKAFMGTNRLGAQITCRCDVRLLADAADELVGNAVNFSSVLFAQANGQYLVTEWSFVDSYSSIEVSLVEYDPTVETDYTAAADEQSFVLAPLNVS